MIPVPLRLSAIVLVLETTPLTIRVPPLAWLKTCAPEAAHSTMGAEIVLVPLVISELIAEPAPVPVLVSVSLIIVLELVRLYPEAVVVLKFNC